jgi:hypothetical protein
MKKLCIFSATLLLSVNTFAQLFKSGNAATLNSNNLLLYSLCLSLLDDSNNQPSVKPLAYHSGYAITNSNDTLKGNICLRTREISLIAKRNTINVDTIIEICDINSVRLFAADSLLNNKPYTDYIKLKDDKHYLWRQVYKGSFEIYDDLYASNERPGKTGEFFMVKENDTPRIISGFWAISPKKNVINYVNERYSKNFSKKDFNEVTDIINWLKING